MSSHADHSASELKLIRIATVLTVIYAAFAVGIALISDSVTLLLDGMYSVVDMLVSFCAIYVIRKLHEPPNDKFHYGYAKFEPLMTLADGILLLGLCVMTFINCAQDLVHPDPVDHANVIVVFTFVSIFLCIGFGLYMRRKGKAWRSEVLVTDSQLWIMEGLISLGVCIAFSVGIAMEHSTAWKQYTAYVDPLTCMVIACIFLVEPFKILRFSFKDLVDACPSDEIRQRVGKLVEECCEKHHLSAVDWYRLRKSGRRIFVQVSFTAPETLTVKEMEDIRHDMKVGLKEKDSELDIVIMFDTLENDLKYAKRVAAEHRRTARPDPAS